MNKHFTIFIVFLITLLSCEKDDICVEQITSNLIVRFYDNEDRTKPKALTKMYIWASGKDSIVSYINKSLDSISLPLNLSENVTKYVIENNSVKDTVEFTYLRNDIFVSRSCGYKTIFENLAISKNTVQWIIDAEIINSTIENETAKHINIYH